MHHSEFDSPWRLRYRAVQNGSDNDQCYELIDHESGRVLIRIPGWTEEHSRIANLVFAAPQLLHAAQSARALISGHPGECTDEHVPASDNTSRPSATDGHPTGNGRLLIGHLQTKQPLRYFVWGTGWRHFTPRTEETLLDDTQNTVNDLMLTLGLDSDKRNGPKLTRNRDPRFCYLVGKDQHNHGYFIISNSGIIGDLDLHNYSIILREARKARLKPPYIIYARYEVYQSPNVFFRKLASAPRMKGPGLR